jgi:hypothetical protein
MITPINSPHPVDVHPCIRPQSPSPIPKLRLRQYTKAAKCRKTRSR